MRKNCVYSNVEIETVGGSVSVENITSNHKVLCDDGKFHKVRIYKARRILARFIPQSWINNKAVEIDGARYFDVTGVVKKMGKTKALSVKDNDLFSDDMAIKAGMLGDHSGPFRVEVESAIRNYFGLTG